LAPLHRAARTPHLGVVHALLEGGAQVDLVDSRNGWTPLQHAVHKGQDAAALALLEAGAEPRRALVMAAGYGNTRIVRALLAHGAEPAADALWAAAGGGAISDITDGPPLGTCFPETVQALLEHAPGLRLRRGMDTRLLSWFAGAECEDLLQRLQQG
jgi:ankyrin repeat protein